MSRVGAEVFRSQFADWAGHNCANMDYLTREQVNDKYYDNDSDSGNDDIEAYKQIKKSDVAVRTRPVGGDPCWGLVGVQAFGLASS